MFKLSGEFVTTFGTKGNGNGEFDDLTGLTLCSTGLLFVCDHGNKRVQVFDTQQDHQFQYSFGHGRFILDLTLNATEDKLFAISGSCILVFTPQGQFLYPIAVDPVYCDLSPMSICYTPDNHLLVGCFMSSSLFSVLHEDGTLVCHIKFDLSQLVDKSKDTDFSTNAVHMRRDGQTMVAFTDEPRLIMTTKYGLVLL